MGCSMHIKNVSTKNTGSAFTGAAIVLTHREICPLKSFIFFQNSPTKLQKRCNTSETTPNKLDVCPIDATTQDT